MKFSVALSVLFVCFVSNSYCLKCYDCIDSAFGIYSTKCNYHQRHTNCRGGDSDFCMTVTFTNSPVAPIQCGEKELCMSKSCASAEHCKSAGTHKIELPNNKSFVADVSCCEGDFCNDDVNVDYHTESVDKKKAIIFVAVVYSAVALLFVFKYW